MGVTGKKVELKESFDTVCALLFRSCDTPVEESSDRD